MLALIDGFGVRTLIGDSQVPLERARRAVASAVARDLGLGETLTRPNTSVLDSGKRSDVVF